MNRERALDACWKAWLEGHTDYFEPGTPNIATLHSGEPVTSGHKIIITKWFRARGSGPMFHED